MKSKVIKILIVCVLAASMLSGCINYGGKIKPAPTLTKEQIEADDAAREEVDATYPKPDMETYARISAQEGWDVYVPGAGGYRYGPTILLNEDKSIDLWTASNGALGQWDWIRYKRSTDGGKTWTDDVVPLKPTPNSLDAYSTCDPGVIKIGKYYYIGYTSTSNMNGTFNHVYVARSLNAAGPFDKWNGTGWGGNPQPIVMFDGPAECWGAGEPSFVVKNGVLYIYYTWTSKDAKGKALNETRVATAPALDENWPAKMEYKGIAIKRSANAEDSTDVKFVEETGKFIGIATEIRITKNSRIVIYQSEDGITFTCSGYIKTNTAAFLHNIGLSSRPNGHISLQDQNYIAYAYGPQWGRWATRFHPISLSDVLNKLDPETNAANLPLEVPDNPVAKERVVGIFAAKPYIHIVVSDHEIPLNLFALYNDDSLTDITKEKGITYTDYNKKIIEVNNKDGTFKALTVGETSVTVNYNGFKDVLLISTFVSSSPKLVDAKTSSIEGPIWPESYLIDIDKSTVWSSRGGLVDKWAFVKLETAQTISGVMLSPRVDGRGFPVDFKFQSSIDGNSWTDIPGQTYTNYTNPANETKSFIFESKINAQYIKIICTKAEPKTGEYLQLSEIEIIGETAPSVVSMKVIKDNGKIFLSQKTALQIKEYVEMSTGDIKECFKGTDGLTYSNFDANLISVSKDGLIKPAIGNLIGKTTVTVTIGDKTSTFEVEIVQ